MFEKIWVNQEQSLMKLGIKFAELCVELMEIRSQPYKKCRIKLRSPLDRFSRVL